MPQPKVHPLPLFLVSASLSRQALLTQAGLTFESRPSRVDEAAITGKTPDDRSTKLAKAKIEAILPVMDKPALLLSADTVIVWNNKVLEKPKFKMTAVEMLKKLSGSVHTVVTGWAIYNSYKQTWFTGTALTYVTFRPLTYPEIVAYADDYPVTQWAGGYNTALSRAPEFITKIDGSLTGLNGLPLDQICPILHHEWAHPYIPRTPEVRKTQTPEVRKPQRRIKGITKEAKHGS